MTAKEPLADMIDLAGMMVIQDEELEVLHLHHGGQTLGFLKPMAAYRLALLLSDAARSLTGKQWRREQAAQRLKLSELALKETEFLVEASKPVRYVLTNIVRAAHEGADGALTIDSAADAIVTAWEQTLEENPDAA